MNTKMLISRDLKPTLEEKLFQGKAIVVLGPRQVGKTTLLKDLFQEREGVLWLNGDEEEVRSQLTKVSASAFTNILGENKILIIDEAQRITDIGLKLKIIQDNFGQDIQLIATGSSSFDLANQINEPLTGRKWEYRLLQISFKEMAAHHGLINEKSNLENRLLYGYYPDIVTHPAQARSRLELLVNDNLYKDVFRLDGINKPTKLEKLLQALAFQIGSQVSVNELARSVGIDNKTVEKYLRLLEQSFIIFRLPSFAKNLRSELRSSQKYYFYDLGVRNGLIDDFRPLDLRQDTGVMFENFIISEIQKSPHPRRQYFWRTAQQQEIDYVYQKDGALGAIEIKWNEKKKPKFSKTFIDNYQPQKTFFINRENFFHLLLEDVF